jgi:hypothetical protein
MEQVMEQKQTKKLSQDELNTISQFRQHMQEKVMQYGELELDMVLTKKRLEELELEKTKLTTELETKQNDERKFVQSLNDKYGVGTLNIDTGEFIPS